MRIKRIIFTQMPLVLVSQEHKGQIYLSLHHDLHPQLMIENKCGVKLFCAQFSEEKPASIISDCKHLKWLCSIDNESVNYYTMPDLCGKFLETLQCSNSENIAFASDPEGIFRDLSVNPYYNINFRRSTRIPMVESG